MEKFSLEEAKKGKRLITRSRQHAEFVDVLDGGQPAPMVVNVYRQPFTKLASIRAQRGVVSAPLMENYYIDGKHEAVHESPLDLFIAEIDD